MKNKSMAHCNLISLDELKFVKGGTNGGGIDPGKKEEKTEAKKSIFPLSVIPKVDNP